LDFGFVPTGDTTQPTDLQPGTRPGATKPGAKRHIVTPGERIHVVKGICLSQTAIGLIVTLVQHATPLR
jgi:hypothetical protein